MATAANSSCATVCEEGSLTQEETRQENTLKLKLKKAKKDNKKIQWTEDTVDNEGELCYCKTVIGTVPVATNILENQRYRLQFFFYYQVWAAKRASAAVNTPNQRRCVHYFRFCSHSHILFVRLIMPVRTLPVLFKTIPVGKGTGTGKIVFLENNRFGV
jgi:Protein phosphatase inhibitor